MHEACGVDGDGIDIGCGLFSFIFRPFSLRGSVAAASVGDGAHVLARYLLTCPTQSGGEARLK